MKKKILILGISGSLGHTLFLEASKEENFFTYGTVQNIDKLPRKFLEKYRNNILTGYKIKDAKSKKLENFLHTNKIDILINCIGVIKQHSSDLQETLFHEINSYFPKYLEKLTTKHNTKLIHISSDCVFDGEKGGYKETSIPNAKDIYGTSKLLGEVDSKNTITLRTSFIGHELNNNLGLLEWFLSQNNQVEGYQKAYFSGTTTVELSNIILKYIIPNKKLSGIFHIGGKKIDKFSLLNIIKDIYKKSIQIKDNKKIIIDRSLDPSKFIDATNYKIKPWEQLIKEQKKQYDLTIENIY